MERVQRAGTVIRAEFSPGRNPSGQAQGGQILSARSRFRRAGAGLGRACRFVGCLLFFPLLLTCADSPARIVDSRTGASGSVVRRTPR
jgi:hypothetical protein